MSQIMISPDSPKTLDREGFEALEYYTLKEIADKQEAAAKKLAISHQRDTM